MKSHQRADVQIRAVSSRKGATRGSVDDISARWIARKDGGLTPIQENNLSRWCQADPRHAAALARLEAVWQKLCLLRTFVVEQIDATSQNGSRRSNQRGLRKTASVLLRRTTRKPSRALLR